MRDYKDLLIKDRLYNMGMAMIFIMLFHEQFLHAGFFESIRHWGHLGVDVFFSLSGWGIAHSLNKNNLCKFYYNRIIRLLPSCLMWGTIALFVSICIDGIFPPLRYYVLTPLCLDKWFIFAIVLFYAISPLLFRMGKNNIVILLSSAYCVSLLNCRIDLNGWWPLNWAMDRFPVYCAGLSMFFLKELKLDWKILLVSGVFLLYLSFNIIPGKQNFMYLFFIPTIPILFFLMHYAKMLFSYIHLDCFIEWVGAWSLEIYLIHELVFKEILKLDMTPYLQFVFAFAISFFFAYLTSKILPNIWNLVSRLISIFLHFENRPF